MKEFYDAIQKLPSYIKERLKRISPKAMNTVTEIHLRSERAVTVTIGNEQFRLSELCDDKDLIITHQQLYECFLALCDHSLHSYEDQLHQGYFTLNKGHRVGVAGILQTDDISGKLKGVRAVTSLNIRIAKTVQMQISEIIKKQLNQKNCSMLLIGPPGSGKTTLLRSISAEISKQRKKVAVIDERMEIWPCGSFGFVYDVPENCDVLSGCSKPKGIIQALRTLGPQVILCDEIGGAKDAAAIEKTVHAGVSVVCTMHGDDFDAFEKRFGRENQISARAFNCIVLLQGAENPGEVQEVRRC